MTRVGLDRRLKRARKEAEDGTWDGLNRALETVAPSGQELFWDWYIGAMQRAPAGVDRKVKTLFTTLGSNEVDLHGLHRVPAVSVVSRALNTFPPGERITFITGKGRRSKCKQSILFTVVKKLLDEAGVPTEDGPNGRWVVDFNAEHAAAWRAYWTGLCTEGRELPSCDRIQFASNPSNVSERHWHREKQAGVDRRKGIAKTKAKLRISDARGKWPDPRLL